MTWLINGANQFLLHSYVQIMEIFAISDFFFLDCWCFPCHLIWVKRAMDIFSTESTKWKFEPLLISLNLRNVTVFNFWQCHEHSLYFYLQCNWKMGNIAFALQIANTCAYKVSKFEIVFYRQFFFYTECFGHTNCKVYSSFFLALNFIFLHVSHECFYLQLYRKHPAHQNENEMK